MRLIYPLPAVLLALAVTASGDATMAQAADSAPAGLSIWDRVVVQIYEWQRDFHRELTQHLRDISAGGGSLATWSLIIASFLYGVFHAAGPGHGKAVLSAYLLTHREQVRRGVGLAFAASFCQGLVALVVVYGLVFLAGLVMSETQMAVRWTERASFFAVALMGLYLAWRAATRLYRVSSPRMSDRTDHSCCEGHAHLPSEDAAASRTPLATLGVILSIGLRPCSGAVVVLVFAQIASIPWAGIVAVAAMSVGTGITVAMLAFVAVHLRNWAAGVAVLDSAMTARVSGGIGLIGGLTIGVLGFSLLSTSFAPVHPMGL